MIAPNFKGTSQKIYEPTFSIKIERGDINTHRPTKFSIQNQG